MMEEIEVQETKNVMFIQVNNGKVQRLTYTIIFQDILSLLARRNIPNGF